jgi:cytochrome P450
MFTTVIFALSSLILGYLVWTLARLVTNYHSAQGIGLPLLICPVDPAGPLWMVCKDVVKPVLVRLPLGLGTWASRAEVGWTFFEKYDVHAQHGDAFVIVSPGENDVVIAHPPATADVMRRRNDFVKNPAMYGMLDIYGPNVDTVNGKLWDRHRKVTVPPFNEHNSALVWREAADQVDQMLAVWCAGADPGAEDEGNPPRVVTTTQPDVHALALNVLCGAGFGVHSSFVDAALPNADSDAETEAGPKRLGYRESLRMLLASIVPLVLLGVMKRAGVPSWLFLGRLHDLSVAYDEFKGYMGEMLARERTAYEQGDSTRHNLMSALVRANEQSSEAAKAATGAAAAATAAGLTDDEVFGNLFIFNLAGHDTTAATLHFAITLLAAHPEWQTWVGQEIDQVRQQEADAGLYYEGTFPKLHRCMALMVSSPHPLGSLVVRLDRANTNTASNSMRRFASTAQWS